MLLRRILLPVARSASSEAAIRYAKQIASATKTELYLLHVAKPSLFRSHGYDWPAEANTSMDAVAPRTSRLVLQGRPADMILAYADQIDADLILMPTHGRSILGQLFLGSTTMEVVRRTERTVWVVKTGWLMAEERSACRNVVCGIDLNAEGLEVLKRATEVAAFWKSELTIVHAIPGLSEAVLARYGLEGDANLAMLPAAARRTIECLIADADMRSPLRVQVSIGDPADLLSRAARRADLVLIGRGRRTDAWSLSAHITDIIGRVSCPVLTYRNSHVAAHHICRLGLPGTA